MECSEGCFVWECQRSPSEIAVDKPPAANSDNEGDGEGDEEDDDEADQDEPDPKGRRPKAKAKPQAKKKTWDKSVAVAAKIRTESTTLCALRNSLQQKAASIREAFADHSKMSTAGMAACKVEKDTLVTRMSWLEAVLSKTPENLEKLIRDAQQTPGSGAMPAPRTGSGS